MQPGSVKDASLLAVSSVIWYFCCKDPNKLSLHDKPSDEKFMEFFLKTGSFSIYIMGVLSVVDLYLSNTDSSESPPLFPLCKQGSIVLPPSSIRILGFTLMIIFGLVRLSAMQTLGSLFTFQLSIRPSHKLITSGPYSIVRHPSYTGVYGLVVGGNLIFFTGGIGAKLLGSTACSGWIILALGFLPLIVMHTRILGKRIPGEEKMLREEFKDEWDEYAQRVQWRIFPGIW